MAKTSNKIVKGKQTRRREREREINKEIRREGEGSGAREREGEMNIKLNLRDMKKKASIGRSILLKSRNMY